MQVSQQLRLHHANTLGTLLLRVPVLDVPHSDEVAEWVKKRDKLRLAGKEKNDE